MKYKFVIEFLPSRTLSQSMEGLILYDIMADIGDVNSYKHTYINVHVHTVNLLLHARTPQVSSILRICKFNFKLSKSNYTNPFTMI